MQIEEEQPVSQQDNDQEEIEYLNPERGRVQVLDHVSNVLIVRLKGEGEREHQAKYGVGELENVVDSGGGQSLLKLGGEGTFVLIVVDGVFFLFDFYPGVVEVRHLVERRLILGYNE